MIWAKFKSFLGHIADKHENLEDPIFYKCAHGEIEHRQWLNDRKLLYVQLLKSVECMHKLVIFYIF